MKFATLVVPLHSVAKTIQATGDSTLKIIRYYTMYVMFVILRLE